MDQSSILTNPYVIFLAKFVLAVCVTFFAIMIAKYLASMVRKKIIAHSTETEDGLGEESTTAPQTQIAYLVEDIVYYFLTIIAVFIGFQIVGFDVGLILGGISFGIGLAFKEVLGNMIAGIFLLTMKEIKLGDVVLIHSKETYFGTIEEITIRTTALRTFDLKQVILPNIMLIDCPIQTYSAEEIIRLDTALEVHYDSDMEKVCKVLATAINSCPFILNPTKTHVFVDAFEESGVRIKCLFFVNPRNGWIQDQLIGYVNHVIFTYAKANAIVIPYPHLTIISSQQ